MTNPCGEITGLDSTFVGMAQPLSDVEVEHHGGMAYSCTAIYKDGTRVAVVVPRAAEKPMSMDYESWTHNFSDAEVIAAAKVYTDIWTWQDSSPENKAMMDAFTATMKNRRKTVKLQPAEGAIRYNAHTDCMECYDGHGWNTIAPAEYVDITDVEKPNRTS